MPRLLEALHQSISGVTSQKTMTIPLSKLSPTAVPAPTSSGPTVTSSPVYPWSSRPRRAMVSATPSTGPPVTVSSLVPDRGGGIPFINLL
ncbi:hypothetical protein V6N13_008104 [Hibiscus sabdariffa]